MMPHPPLPAKQKARPAPLASTPLAALMRAQASAEPRGGSADLLQMESHELSCLLSPPPPAPLRRLLPPADDHPSSSRPRVLDPCLPSALGQTLRAYEKNDVRDHRRAA